MLYQVLIRWQYRKLGYAANIETNLSNGRRIDVLAVKKKRIGVEIELNPHNEQRNKLIGIDELDELYILSNSKEKLNIIRAKLGKIPEKVKLMTVRKFLIKLYNISRNFSGIYSKRGKGAEFVRSRNLIEKDD